MPKSLNLLPKAKFICGFIYLEEEIYLKTKKVLEKKLGQIDFESEKINFDFTDYYYRELGFPLFRKFISFKKPRRLEELAAVKRFCMRLEKKFFADGKRRINIDPGYLTEEKLVLATTKNYYHRIYLGKGIYAEVTLAYKRGEGFADLPTTYPDYRSPQYKNIFLKIRETYRRQLQKQI